MVVVTIMVIMSERRVNLSLFQNLFHTFLSSVAPTPPRPTTACTCAASPRSLTASVPGDGVASIDE